MEIGNSIWSKLVIIILLSLFMILLCVETVGISVLNSLVSSFCKCNSELSHQFLADRFNFCTVVQHVHNMNFY